MKLRPVRQLPSGAKRASGMLISPVCPLTLGSAAIAGAAASISRSGRRRIKKKGPARGPLS